MNEFKKILVPTDFSAFADHALAYARAFAKQTGGSVHCVHVVDSRAVEGGGVEGIYINQADLDATLQAVKEHADAKMEHVVLKDQPVISICRQKRLCAVDVAEIATHFAARHRPAVETCCSLIVVLCKIRRVFSPTVEGRVAFVRNSGTLDLGRSRSKTIIAAVEVNQENG